MRSLTSIMAVWLATMIVVFFVFKTMGTPWLLDSAVWQVMIALGTWILAAGVVYAFYQVRQARRSTNAQIALEVFRELRNPETVETLREIYELTQDECRNIPTEIGKKIDHLIDKYGALEIWVNTGIIDEKIAVEAGPAALRCWYRLHSYIKSTRNTRGYYGDNFEAFVRLSLDYFYKNKIRIKLWQEGHRGEDVDLITELQDERIHPRTLKEIKKAREKNSE
jgi:hypothetical protein